jgi:ATPase family associated with various cellular activities (AAA)
MSDLAPVIIPQRFTSVVHTHLARNLQPNPPASIPLLLGIHGRPGEGKTFQLRHVLEDSAVHVVLLSGGQLESSDAGEPGARVRDAYLEAGTFISNGLPASVILNDTDAAIGNWGELTQYTVNTQNVITELMHLCDYPTRVEGKQTPRVPIFLTGNDFTRLYMPLRRHGRMELFRWEMSRQERKQILATLFRGLDSREIDLLLERYPEYSIADWTAVSSRISDYKLSKFLASSDVRALLPKLLRGARLEFSSTPPALDDILEALNYLERNRSVNLLPGDT